jgi:DNA-binding transcriptional LysR family regulator
MEFRQLVVFVAVAEQRSFTRAAGALHLVQSGVSATVRSLELELGSPLFDRTSRRVALTPAGEALLPRAREALRALEAAGDSIAAGPSGRVRIGVAAVPIDLVRLPDALAGLRDEHPAISVTVVSTTRGTTGLIKALRGGEVDLALIAIAREPGGIDLHPLPDVRLDLVVAATHRLAGRARVALPDLVDEDFVDMPDGWAARELTDRAFSTAGIHRNVGYQVGDPRTAADFVRAGLGVALLPASSVTDRTGLDVIELEQTLRLPVSIAVPSDGRLGAAGQAVLDRLLDLTAGRLEPGLPRWDGGES